KWQKVAGKDGIPGEPGANGKTSYLHIRYSNDGGKTFTANDGETVGDWIGQRVDFVQADSNKVTDYKWSKIKGEQGPKGDPTGITVSATAPASPYTNQLWKNTGTSGGWIKDATYRRNGSSWEIYTFVAKNILAETLSALAANLGDVNGGSY